MAKAVDRGRGSGGRSGGPPAKQRPTGAPRPGPRSPVVPSRTERGNYFKDVYLELRKVVWPARDELLRMTGIVIVTVLIFAAIIGLADFLLSLAVRQLYTHAGTTTIPLPTPTPVPKK